MPKMNNKAYKKEICVVCGKTFTKRASSGAINCPDCQRNKRKGLERPYTRDTVFLVCKWYDEGVTVKRLASLLQRSEDNICKALKLGGKDVP